MCIIVDFLFSHMVRKLNKTISYWFIFSVISFTVPTVYNATPNSSYSIDDNTDVTYTCQNGYNHTNGDLARTCQFGKKCHE